MEAFGFGEIEDSGKCMKYATALQPRSAVTGGQIPRKFSPMINYWTRCDGRPFLSAIQIRDLCRIRFLCHAASGCLRADVAVDTTKRLK